MKRLMCIWLPDWPLQRILGERPELRRSSVARHSMAGRPPRSGGLRTSCAVLYSDCGHRGLRVVMCSRSAVEEGVAPGMPLAEARALLERGASGRERSPHFHPYDPQADLAVLRQLAEECRRYSPVVGIEETAAPDSLLLDVTGCDHLFHGERGLAERVARDFCQRGLAVRVAIADTIGAAWACARFQSAIRNPQSAITTIIPPARHQTALQALPVEALRLPHEVVETLHELDLRRIGQLQALPRAGLPARFGSEVLRRLDQALGRIPELIDPLRQAEPMEICQSFDDPIADRRTLEAVLKRMIEQIVETLAPRRQGVRQLACWLRSASNTPHLTRRSASGGREPPGSAEAVTSTRTGGLTPPARREEQRSIRFSVELVRPTVSARHLFDLVRLQLERVSLPAEVSSIRLQATATAPLESRQQSIFDDDSNHRHSNERRLAGLLDRMSSRLGDEWVLRPRLVPDAQPEHAARLEPMTGNGPRINPQSAIHNPQLDPVRPLLLKSQPVAVEVLAIFPEGPPVRFRWEGRDYVIVWSRGPERIETGWWRGPDVRRDYYHVETTKGRRFWLFRRIGERDWFLHGTFE